MDRTLIVRIKKISVNPEQKQNQRFIISPTLHHYLF
ncbi:hypothetical protein BGS_1132 [Beggiatoa sp. SS]|nr:hypothetical protein BGS_1132 [Beggiatoa sp. SS]